MLYVYSAYILLHKLAVLASHSNKSIVLPIGVGSQYHIDKQACIFNFNDCLYGPFLLNNLTLKNSSPRKFIVLIFNICSYHCISPADLPLVSSYYPIDLSWMFSTTVLININKLYVVTFRANHICVCPCYLNLCTYVATDLHHSIGSCAFAWESHQFFCWFLNIWLLSCVYHSNIIVLLGSEIIFLVCAERT